jgi:hypothetical protein
MVNGGFPATCRYGFEMVDRRKLVAAIGVNQKFTPNQIDRFFGEFFSI